MINVIEVFVDDIRWIISFMNFTRKWFIEKIGWRNTTCLNKKLDASIFKCENQTRKANFMMNRPWQRKSKIKRKKIIFKCEKWKQIILLKM